ncbi:E3 ubiquitin-protein ligase TRIM71-like [Mytilus edulis]|uniref:E3 ubiquitin-protein ligase TRIM71-like n=1 Tax=Mytilus edulis TaxID=6550 RepID=UPI0039EF30AE
MATSSTFICGVCNSQHITKDAQHWCPECEEGLCPNCLIFHNSSKLLRGHGVISIKNYKQLPQYIRSIRQHCPDHDRKYQHYCPNHGIPCCPFCITTSHSKCNGLQVLEEVVKTSELSGQYEDMKQSLRDIGNNIERIKIDREGNVKSILEQRKKFQSEITMVRQQINSHLDKLEEQAIENLKSTEDKVKHQIKTLLSKLSTSSEEAKELGNIISAMSIYASDLQRFLGRKEIESKVAKSEEYISSLVADGSLQQVTLTCSIDSNISGILSSISSLCTISTETSKTNILLTNEKEKQAQIMTFPPRAQTSIYDIKVELIQTLTIPKYQKNSTCITGCTINPSGKLIFADFTNNKRLVIMNADGTLDGELKLSAPYDVTSIDDRRVAVNQSKQIQIIDLVSKKVENTLHVKNSIASGIAYGNDMLLFYESGKGILMFKLTETNDPITVVNDSNTGNWNFIASFQNNIYRTSNHTVTCYNVSGEKVWEFKDKNVISLPRSVAVDQYSNVYVASTGKRRIVVISPDGLQSRTLISNVDSWGIDIDTERHMLMVTELPSDFVRVYKIS